MAKANITTVHQFEFNDWPILPVRDEERHVHRHLQWRSKQLKFQVEKAEGENREQLEAEQFQVIRLLFGLEQAWKKVDMHFDAFIVAMAYLEEVEQDLVRNMHPREYEKTMLTNIVPRVKDYVNALVGVIQRRREACWSVLEGQYTTWMTDNDLSDVMGERNHLLIYLFIWFNVDIRASNHEDRIDQCRTTSCV